MIKLSRKTLADSSGKRRHSYQPHFGSQHSIGQTARFNHWRAVLYCPIWNLDRYLALSARERLDLNLMGGANLKVCRLRRDYRDGINGEQEFTRKNSRPKCCSIFDYIQEHPSLASRRIDGAECCVDGAK